MPKSRKTVDVRAREVGDLVNAGRMAEAEAQLASIRGVPRARPTRLVLADCHRLLGRPEVAISILRSTLRPEGGKYPGQPAGPDEKRVYSASLRVIGAIREAAELIDEIDPRKEPRALMEQGLGRIGVWDWIRAHESFERYLSTKIETHPLNRMTARLYRASCVLHGLGDPAESRRQLDCLFQETQGCFASIARGALLLLAQGHVLARNPRAAARVLDQLDALLAKGDDRRQALASKKWRALAELLGPRPKEASARLDRIAVELGQSGIWERVRGIDYYRGVLVGDPAAFDRVWHGSPFPALRARIESRLAPRKVSPVFVWRLGQGSERSATTVAALDGSHSQGRDILKPGQIQLRLLQALCSDHYRPLSAAELHERIYPGEYFNPGASRLRIHQAIWRLRGWFGEQKLPVVVDEADGLYRLSASGPVCRIRLEAGPTAASGESRIYLKLTPVWQAKGQEWFTVQEAASLLDISRSTAFRRLIAAKGAGYLETAGEGRAERYRFTAG